MDRLSDRLGRVPPSSDTLNAVSNFSLMGLIHFALPKKGLERRVSMGVVPKRKGSPMDCPWHLILGSSLFDHGIAAGDELGEFPAFEQPLGQSGQIQGLLD